MKKLKIEKLCSCFAAMVAATALTYSASAKEVEETLFLENADSVTTALGAGGITQYGTWSCSDGLAAVMQVVNTDVVLDVDEEAPLSYSMKNTGSVADSPTIKGEYIFGRAYETAPTIDGAKVGLCVVKDGTVNKFAYVSDGAWVTSSTEVPDVAGSYLITINMEVALGSGLVHYYVYDIDGQGEDVLIGTGSVGNDATIETAQFAGAGSFKAIESKISYDSPVKVDDKNYRTAAEASAAITNGCSVVVQSDSVTLPVAGNRIGFGLTFEPDTCADTFTLDDAALKANGFKGVISGGQYKTSLDLASGEGTEANPFAIASEADFNTLAKAVKSGLINWANEKYYKLANDVEMAGKFGGIGIANDSTGTSVKDIVTGSDYTELETKAFRGVFNGNGKTISNIVFTKNDGLFQREYCGFFNSAYGATISNITFKIGGTGFDPNETAVANFGGGVAAGSIADTLLADVTVGTQGDTETVFTGNHALAGVAGCAAGGCTFKNVKNYLNVSTTSSKAAGLVCLAQGTKVVDDAIAFIDCENYGNVTTAGSNGTAAFVGYDSVDIEFSGTCVAGGTFTATGNAASVIGKIDGAEVSVDDGASLTVPLTIKTIGSGTAAGLNYVETSTGAVVPEDDLDIGNVYKVMTSVASYADEFTEADQTMSFDCSFNSNFEATFECPTGYKATLTTAGNVKTYTCEINTVAIYIDTTTVKFNANITGVTVKQDDEEVTAGEGGQYKLDPSTGYVISFKCATGYYCDETIKVDTPVAKTYATADFENIVATPYGAKIGETYYKTLEAALTASKGAEVTVLVAVTFEGVDYTANNKIIADGDEFVITAGNGQTTIGTKTIGANKSFGTTDGNVAVIGEITFEPGSKFFYPDPDLLDGDIFCSTQDVVVSSAAMTEGTFTGCYQYSLKSGEPTPEQQIQQVVKNSVNDFDDLPPDDQAAAAANIAVLIKAKGSADAVDQWVATVYDGDKMDAGKLARSTTVDVSAEYDLPIMAGKVTVEVENATSGNGFVFTIGDQDGQEVSMEAAKIQKMIKYTASVDGEFGDSTDKVAVEAQGPELKASFSTPDAAKGFMKLDLSVEK